jgi:AraC-like DNA-binding protein
MVRLRGDAEVGKTAEATPAMMREGTRIQDVATRVGYDSEAAFNRAFKRATGCPPAAWRRSAS